MLIYKAWLETRWRFLAGLLLIIAITVYAVFRAPAIIPAREQFDAEALPYAKYIWILLYKGYLQALWILSAVMLGLGGLWHEKSSGTANFTLSLPITRRQIILSRTIFGAVEVIILAVIPSILIWAISPLAGYSFPFGEAIFHAILMIGGGLIFYSLGILLSFLMRGEFSTATLALGICLISYTTFNILRFKTYNPFDMMSGKYYLDPNTFLLRSEFPWMPLGVYLIAVILMIFVCLKIAERRDF